MPTSPHAVVCYLCKNCELTIRDSDGAVAYLASQVWDDCINGQIVTQLPMNLYQHRLNASLDEMRQQYNLRPVFDEKTMFVN